MPFIADAVAQIRAADLLVLFIDTCSIVDPIRTPLRPDDLQLHGCSGRPDVIHGAPST
jgi:hypothetical protein